MQHTYDLVAEPWLPCRTLHGESACLGLEAVLVRAHELAELRDDSPLVTIALHRLLLAVLHRVLGPKDEDHWLELWQAGRLPAEPFTTYVAEWRERFDLCHPQRPFFQTPGLKDAKPVSVYRLAFVQGNNATLFDHRTESEEAGLPPDVAARLLATYQAFAIGGGVSKPFNLSHSPVAREGGFLCLVNGPSLFHTLMLNAIAVTNQPFTKGNDHPTWELDDPPEPARNAVPVGYTDYLTWQSRRVELVPDPGSELCFSRVRMLQGQAPSDVVAGREPMCAYQQDKKGQFRAVGFREGRALWRDSHTLLAAGELKQYRSSTQTAEWRAPEVLSQLATLREYGYLDPDQQFVLSTYGMSTNQAKISLWRHETLPLPVALLGKEGLLGAVRRAVGCAEGGGLALWAASRRLAELALRPEGGRADPEDVSRLAESLKMTPRYWAGLEHPFRQWLVSLPECDPADVRPRLLEWARSVCAHARATFDRAVAELEQTGSLLKAVHQAHHGIPGAASVLNMRLHKTLKELSLLPEEENADVEEPATKQ